jgi:hypothetical protein
VGASLASSTLAIRMRRFRLINLSSDAPPETLGARGVGRKAAGGVSKLSIVWGAGRRLHRSESGSEVTGVRPGGGRG